MRNFSYFILIILLTTAELFAATKDQPQKVLPSVLIIGDVMYQQSSKVIANELKGKANVVVAKWPADLIPNSTNAIEQIDLLLGIKDASGNDIIEAKRPSWNIVHVNVGLGDLIYRVPSMKSHRSLPYDFGGIITTNPEQYEKNLNVLISTIKQKAPTAKIIWANTTPIIASPNNWFKPGSEIEYNQIAERVMKKYGVPINDVNAYALTIINKKKLEATHPFDRNSLPTPVAAGIVRELKAQ